MQSKRFVLLIVVTLFVFGTAFTARAVGTGSLENKFYTSHEAHSHLGTIDLDSGVGTDIGPYEHRNLVIDISGYLAASGAVYRNHFYTILNRPARLGEDPPEPKAEARLARVNVHTGKVKLLGSPIDLNLFGLEISHCGEVFATGFSLIHPIGDFHGDTNLYRVDRRDASLTLVGDTGLERIMDLAFDPAGTLWATVGNKLYTLDTDTGTSTEIAAITDVNGDELPIETEEIMGIAFTSNGDLFGTSIWSGMLYSIDPESGAATEVGNSGFIAAHGGDIPMIPNDARCP